MSLIIPSPLQWVRHDSIYYVVSEKLLKAVKIVHNFTKLLSICEYCQDYIPVF